MGNPAPPPASYALLSALIGYANGQVLTQAQLDAIGNLVLRGDGQGNFAEIKTARIGTLGFLCCDAQSGIWLAENAYTDDGINWFAFNSALGAYALQFTTGGVILNFSPATGAAILWQPFQAFSNTAYDSTDPTEEQIYALQVAIGQLQNAAYNGGMKPLANGPVSAATTAALPANTDNNGSAGVGATLTGNANGALPNIDGVVMEVGYQIWVQNEANGANNGVYIVTQVGSVSSPYILTRRADANTAAALSYGYALVYGGSTWAGYALGIALPVADITIGTTALYPFAFAGSVAVAAETARAEAAEATLTGTTVTQGLTPVSGVAGATAGKTYFAAQPISQNGLLSSISLYSRVAGPATLVVASLSGGNFTLQQSLPVQIADGLNTVNSFDVIVEAGWYVGIYSATIATPDYASTTGTNMPYCNGLVGTSSPELFNNNISLELDYTVITGILGETTRAMSAEANLQAQLSGSTITEGISPPVEGTNGAGTGYTYFASAPSPQAGILSSVSFYSRYAGPVILVAASLSGSTLSLQATKSVNANVGVNTIGNIDFAIEEGWYIGVYSNSAERIPDYVTASGIELPYCSGLVGSSSTILFNNNLQLEMCYSLIVGVDEQIVWMLGQVASVATGGVGLLSAADPTGVTDSTAAFESAAAAHPNPYVPPAAPDFSVTTLTNNGWGFWGSSLAKILNAGVAVALPEAPERADRWLSLRARLVSQIFTGSPVIFNGDSITNGYNASVFENSYVSLFTRYANMGIAQDEAVFVNFDTTDTSGGPAFEGISFANPTTVTNGTNGPVQKSLMLQPGQSMSFVGAYSDVDVSYNQGASGSTLAFSYNSGAAYKTVTIAAGSGKDMYTGPSATSQTASGAYAITNTGANAVEITALVRLGVLASGSPPPRLYVCRFAHGGYEFSNYGTNQVASMIRIATALAGGTKPLLVPALGTNDEAGAGLSYSTLYANVTTYLGLWTSAGIPVRNIVPIMPWRWSSYASGGSFEQGNAAIRDAFADGGVTRFIKTDGLDFIAYGLSQTGDGHPSDLGHFVEFSSVVDAMVSI